MFASMSRNRAADQENQRTVLDKALFEYFIGRDSIVKSWQQRSAVLALMEPRDRLRLLGLVRPGLRQGARAYD